MEASSNSEPLWPRPPLPPKPRRRLLRLIVIGFCALLLLVLMTPYALSLGFLRSRVLTEINTDLRGKCEIEDVSFSWFSGLSVTGLRIENPPGFESKHSAVTMASLTADVSIASLLFGTFLAGAEIVGLEINIDQKADGTTNLQELLPAPEDQQPETPGEPAPEEPGSGSKSSGADGVGFNVKLRDCTVTIRREGKVLESLTDFACEARSTADSSDIHIDASGKLKAGDLTVNVHVDPSAGTTDAQLITHGLDLQNWWPIVDAFMPAQITALSGKVNGDVTATIRGENSVELSGNLTIDGPRVAGPIVQDMDLRAKQWKITPALAIGGNAASDIDASKFVVDLEWLHLNGKPSTKPGHITLAYDLDVSRVAEFGGPIPEMLKGTGSMLAGVITLPSTELPADAAGWIEALITNADLSAKSLEVGGFKLSDIGLNIKMQDGALTLKTSETTKLDGGALLADISIDLKNLVRMPMHASLKWTGGKLTGGATESLRYVVPLFAGLDAGAAQIVGDVNLHVSFNGPAMMQDGQSLLEWLDTWSGKGSVGLSNTTFAPCKQLQGLLAPLGPLTKGFVPVGDKGQLKVDNFAAPFEFVKGVVSSKSAEWSAAGQKIGLAGNIGFDGKIDYSLDFSALLRGHKDGQKVLKALNGQLPPASLVGSVDDPKLGLPKFGHIAIKLIEQQGKNLLQKGLNRLFRKKK